MDDSHNPPHHHHHELPPFPSAAVTAATILHSPPQNSCYLPPILSQTCLGSFSSSTPQSFFSPHEPQPLTPHFPHSPTFLSYGFNDPTIHSVFPKDDGKKALDAWSTKVARTNRRLARQRTLTSFTTRTSSSSSSSSSSCGYNDDYSKGLTITHFPNTDSSHNNRNLFTFCTPDNKILRMLLKKELKNSDVGSLGRIVLPKREAEENLPFLTDKEGLQIVVRDVNSNRRWTMKYKYWANNRSRMYVLENTGEFVRQNGLLMGDSMTLYEDDCKNLYVAVEKSENHSRIEENYKQKQQQQFSLLSNIDEIKDEEEDASLALLIEELKHKAEDHPSHPPPYFTTNPPNNTMNNPTNSINYKEQVILDDFQGINNNNNNNINNGNGNVGFEDCFGGLDTLPEVSGFKFPLFDYFTSNNDTT